MTNKKLAKLHTYENRVITGFVEQPISDSYYKVQVVKIENPIRDDWKDNDVVKISKAIVNKIEYL